MIEDRDAGSLEMNGRSRAREKWLDSKYTLKTGPRICWWMTWTIWKEEWGMSLRIWPEHLKGWSCHVPRQRWLGGGIKNISSLPALPGVSPHPTVPAMLAQKQLPYSLLCLSLSKQSVPSPQPPPKSPQSYSGHFAFVINILNSNWQEGGGKKLKKQKLQ